MSTWTPTKYAQQKATSATISAWRAGSISKAEAVRRTKRIRRGGGGGAAADPALYAAYLAAEAKRKAAEAEAKAAAEEKARIEAARIAAIKKAEQEAYEKRKLQPSPTETKPGIISRTWGGIVRGYRGAETWTAKRIEKIPTIKEGAIWIKGVQQKVLARMPSWWPGKWKKTEAEKRFEEHMRKVEPFKTAAEFSSGYFRGFREKPIRIGVTTAAFFVLPGAMGVAGKAIAPVTRVIPTTAKVLGTGIKVGLPALYSYTVGKRIYETPSGGRVEQLGYISATEITPMAVGGYAGTKVWPRVSTWFQRGGQRLPKRVEAKVLAAKGLPQAPVKEHYKMFVSKQYAPLGMKKPIGYHLHAGKLIGTYKGPKGEKLIKILSTPELKALGLSVKKREAVGLFLGPYPSIHFGRIVGKPSFYGGSLFEPYTSPKGLTVIPKGFKIAAIKSYQIQVGKGWAGVPGPFIGKPEPQAIIPPGSIFKFTGKRFYFWGKGYKIVLPEIIAVGKGIGKIPSLPRGKLIPSYVGPGISYITTPSTYAVASAISYAPSISAPSYVPSSIPPSLPPTSPPSVSPTPSPVLPSISYIPSPGYAPSPISPTPISPTPSPVLPSISYIPSRQIRPSVSRITLPFLPKLSHMAFAKIFGKELFGYTPSFAGFVWKIKAARIPKPRFGKFTGLEIRPIVPGKLLKINL